MIKVLTLAMSETTSNKFKVILQKITDKSIIDTDLTNQQIKYQNNKYFDIGCVTEIEKLTIRGALNIIEGKTQIIENKSRRDLINLFDLNYNDYITFKRDFSKKYAIIKVDNVLNIEVILKNNNLKTYIDFVTNGIKEKLLIKDFRWINYWNEMYKLNKVEECRERYKNILKNSAKAGNLFLIIYRHRFQNGNFNHWIAGLHIL